MDAFSVDNRTAVFIDSDICDNFDDASELEVNIHDRKLLLPLRLCSLLCLSLHSHGNPLLTELDNRKLKSSKG